MTPIDRERAALRFLDALDAADLETVAELWEQAASDLLLERILIELSEGLFEESGAEWTADVERVQRLLRQHLPSGFPSAEPPRPLTVGDVAARIQADASIGAGIDDADRAVNARLLTEQTRLPDQLGAAALESWTSGLGITASARYWRLFRQTAVLLAMGRCQRAVELAAARRARDGKGGPA